MVFNDTSGGLGLIQDMEFLTGLGTTGISGNSQRMKDFTRLSNKWMNTVESWILESSDSWDFDDSNQNDLPEATTDLVSGRSTYIFPSDILKIKRMEISDGTNWYKAEPFDEGEFGKALDSTTIANNFVKTKPYYEVKANILKLFPVPDTNVDEGLKIYYSREIVPFTTSSANIEPGFDEPFHQVISVGCSWEWLNAKGSNRANGLLVRLQDLELKLRNYYGKKVVDTPQGLQAGYISYE